MTLRDPDVSSPALPSHLCLVKPRHTQHTAIPSHYVHMQSTILLAHAPQLRLQRYHNTMMLARAATSTPQPLSCDICAVARPSATAVCCILCRPAAAPYLIVHLVVVTSSSPTLINWSSSLRTQAGAARKQHESLPQTSSSQP